MLSRRGIAKLQAILIIDIVIIAAAATGYFYVQSLPKPPVSETDVAVSNLQVSPSQAFLGQSVYASFNMSNRGRTGLCSLNVTLDGEVYQTLSETLLGGETKTIEVAFTDVTEGYHTVQVRDLQASFTVLSMISITDLAVNRTEAQAGEPIGITVKVTNLGNQTADYTLMLEINNEAVQTKSGQVEASASVTVLFEVSEQNQGSYQIKIGSLNGSFIISPAAPPAKPAEFQVTNLTIDPDVTEPGVAVNVTAKITNVGETSGSYTADFSVNGETMGSKTVQLSGGESATVVFSVTQSAKGTYTIKVGNATGTLSVQDPSKIALTGLIVRPYEIWAGETVTVIAKGKNLGTESSTLSVRVKVNGQSIESKPLTLAAGEEGEVEFSIVGPELEAGKDSETHIVDVHGMQGGFFVVKNGYHTLAVAISPNGDADFNITLANGVTEKHTTFWSALLPEGTYSVTMPFTDPTGRVTFMKWDDESTSLIRSVNLKARTTVTAMYTGGTSCPSLFMWNGTDYLYVSDVSNHGWLGYINYLNADGSIVYFRNHPWDYFPLDGSQLKPVDGNFNLSLVQRWNEVFYLDRAYMLVVDHAPDVNVYSTMVEQYLDPAYMGNIYTVSKSPLPVVSAVNQDGKNILPQISKIDGLFTSGTNGIQSPEWNNITWNRMTLNLGDLSGAPQIKLVVRAIVDWGSGEDYVTWLDKFFAQPVPDGTQITPPPYMEVKDAKGNWVRVPESRQIPLPPDGHARTFVVDLTGLFPTDDYSLRISNFWNVTYDYIGVDITPQQNVTVQRIDPRAYLYQQSVPGTSAASGNFTRYGNVTELLLAEDDKFVIGRQGDAVYLQFPTANLASPAEGMVRDYFFNDALWFKDENGNWGFGFGFTVDPLPFRNMTGFPYPPDESYPTDEAHERYLEEWNTRVIQPNPEAQQVGVATNGINAVAFSGILAVLVAVFVSTAAPNTYIANRRTAKR